MRGILLSPILVAALSQAPDPAAEMRTISVSITDAKGQPITDLALTDVALVENGVAREIASFERDDRPLTMAVLVDNSQAVSAAYRLNVVDAVLRFLGWLPSGTRFTIWTTGDRPTRILDPTENVATATTALKKTYPIGGNTVLDALAEASRDLRKQEGARTAVVAVSGTGPELSHRPRERVVDEALGGGTVFLGVLFEAEQEDPGSRFNYDYTFENLTEKSGGMRENVLSPMALEGAMRKLAGDLSGRYRLRYATLPELKKRKLEVQVARAGARVRVSEAAP